MLLSLILQGAVIVNLREAKDLPAADSNGLSDPYAILKMGKEEKKSVIMYDTLSPQWNEKIRVHQGEATTWTMADSTTKDGQQKPASTCQIVSRDGQAMVSIQNFAKYLHFIWNAFS